MVTRLDHVVVLVRDLGAAVRDYESLGFAVTPGGEHADGLTRNALIPFHDGSYLELVAFLDPDGSRDNVWGWRRFVSSGGLIDYCVASDDLGADARRLEDLGFDVDGPHDGGRRLPGGPEIRWRVARIRQDGRVMPFLIEDLTPRSSRVPSGTAAEHPNGATGISCLEIATPDPGGATRTLAALIGARGKTLRLDGCTLSPVGPEGRGESMGRIDASGPGPLTVWLAAAAPGGELDRRLAHGVGIRLLQRD